MKVMKRYGFVTAARTIISRHSGKRKNSPLFRWFVGRNLGFSGGFLLEACRNDGFLCRNDGFLCRNDGFYAGMTGFMQE